MGRFSLINFLIYIVTCFLDSGFDICTNSGKDGIEEFTWCSDCFFDVVRVIDLFLVEVRIMLLNCLFYLKGFISSLKLTIVDQFSSIRKNLIQIMDSRWSCEQRNSTESTFEMRKDIGNRIFIVYLNKIDMLMYAIVETADIDEICGFWFVALEFGDFACSYMKWGLPDVKRVFYLKRRRCMKTWSISRSMIAFTVLSYF